MILVPNKLIISSNTIAESPVSELFPLYPELFESEH